MSDPSAAPRPSRGRLFLVLGLGLAVLGFVGYALQLMVLHNLKLPVYLPVAATLGLLCVLAALWRRRTVGRVLALLVVVLLAAGSWAVVLGEPLPAYTGPVAVGKPFPEFATVQADGSPFLRQNLVGDQDNVLVFFRGRW
jgi:4-amino-4-deoxy-L-arabinose transferase-like glycosyltransferase